MMNDLVKAFDRLMRNEFDGEAIVAFREKLATALEAEQALNAELVAALKAFTEFTDGFSELELRKRYDLKTVRRILTARAALSRTPSDALERARKERAVIQKETLEEAAKIVSEAADRFGECERLIPMDIDTGVLECSLDTRGGSCLCLERIEEAEEIQQRIRSRILALAALDNPGTTEGT